nr:MAG TPA: hypothetical protein [Caudoviricetes sp.]
MRGIVDSYRITFKRARGKDGRKEKARRPPRGSGKAAKGKCRSE